MNSQNTPTARGLNDFDVKFEAKSSNTLHSEAIAVNPNAQSTAIKIIIIANNAAIASKLYSNEDGVIDSEKQYTFVLDFDENQFPFTLKEGTFDRVDSQGRTWKGKLEKGENENQSLYLLNASNIPIGKEAITLEIDQLEFNLALEANHEGIINAEYIGYYLKTGTQEPNEIGLCSPIQYFDISFFNSMPFMPMVEIKQGGKNTDGILVNNNIPHEVKIYLYPFNLDEKPLDIPKDSILRVRIPSSEEAPFGITDNAEIKNIQYVFTKFTGTTTSNEAILNTKTKLKSNEPIIITLSTFKIGSSVSPGTGIIFIDYIREGNEDYKTTIPIYIPIQEAALGLAETLHVKDMSITEVDSIFGAGIDGSSYMQFGQVCLGKKKASNEVVFSIFAKGDSDLTLLELYNSSEKYLLLQNTDKSKSISLVKPTGSQGLTMTSPNSSLKIQEEASTIIFQRSGKELSLGGCFSPLDSEGNKSKSKGGKVYGLGKMYSELKGSDIYNTLDLYDSDKNMRFSIYHYNTEFAHMGKYG